LGAIDTSFKVATVRRKLRKTRARFAKKTRTHVTTIGNEVWALLDVSFKEPISRFSQISSKFHSKPSATQPKNAKVIQNKRESSDACYFHLSGSNDIDQVV